MKLHTLRRSSSSIMALALGLFCLSDVPMPMGSSPLRAEAPAAAKKDQEVAAFYLKTLEEYNRGVGEDSQDTGFTFWTKRGLLSKSLVKASKRTVEWEADPFIEAQDVTLGFQLKKSEFSGDQAKLTFSYKVAAGETASAARLVYLLIKEDAQWKLDDIQYHYDDNIDSDSLRNRLKP